MDSKDSEFLKRIQATFRIEAEEHLKAFADGLNGLEKAPAAENIAGAIESLFREIHSLKGAARSVGQKEIESVCQPLESILSGLKKEEILLNPALFDLFFKALAILQGVLGAEGVRQPADDRENLRSLIQQLRKAVPEFKDTPLDRTTAQPPEKQILDSLLDVVPEPEITPEAVKSTKRVLTEMVRIPVAKVDPLLLQAEEFLQTQISINQQTNDLLEICNEVARWKNETLKWKGRCSKASSDQWNEWLESNELQLSNFENQLTALSNSAERVQYNFGLSVDEHLGSVKQLLLLPVSSLVESFPSMVREIAHQQQKEIGFVVNGSDLEIDKRILEELKASLIHLIRNSIDHGIGTPEERRLQNKPSRGTIRLDFTSRGSGFVEITITDDGRGIQTERVLNSAVLAGILTRDEGEKMSTDEIIALVFHSGLSTSSIITDLSGRGLGLSIVREKVGKLNGKLEVESKEHQGTSFRMILPMTLATFRGIVVRVSDFQFILPTMNVERVLRIKAGDISTVENHETIRIDDTILTLVSLAEALGLHEPRISGSRAPEQESGNADFIRIIVLVSGASRIAFKVDEVREEQQVLVKGLGKLLKRVVNISGAAILGSGKIVPVLHVPDLIRSAALKKSPLMQEMAKDKQVVHVGRILVAEDSITSRTLLKNILETAGYRVTTAVDGAAAFTKARSDEFDLIISDVDMPRMNGFELTAKIRSDQKLSEIPVILVTSLESREDRERGIDAGANAYIIKSSFDQGKLLEIIKKLI